MMDQNLKELLDMASLYKLLAKKYEYVDPQKHMHYELLHLQFVAQLEQHYMMLEKHQKPCGCSGGHRQPKMY